MHAVRYAKYAPNFYKGNCPADKLVYRINAQNYTAGFAIMLSKVLDAEHKLDALLPSRPLETNPPGDLVTAAIAWSAAVWAEADKLGPLAITKQQTGQGLTLARHPVYICGVHRSGTTLLRNLLDGHPGLVVLPSEGTFYTVLESKLRALPQNEQMSFLGSEWIRRLANPINQPPYWLLGRSTGSSSPYVDFARYLMTWWKILDHKKDRQAPHIAVVLAYATCTGSLHAKLWVDKTPANERFLNRIWKEVPEAKIIQMIREPVATLNSRKMMEPSLVMRNALLDMRMSFRAALKQSRVNNANYILVRYENLCAEPQAVLEKLCLFMNIPITASLNEPTVAGIPVKANSTFANMAPPGQILKPHQHPQTGAIGAAEYRLLAAYIGRPAKKLNYPVKQISFLHRYSTLLKQAFLHVLTIPGNKFQR